MDAIPVQGMVTLDAIPVQGMATLDAIPVQGMVTSSLVSPVVVSEWVRVIFWDAF